MPNWSFNSLSISGDPEKMQEFYDLAFKANANGEISFKLSNIFPMPEKIKNTISPSSSAKGRQWMNAERSDVRDKSISKILGEDSVDTILIPVENNTDEKCVQLRSQFGADNWYDWNILTYGTKWDCEVLREQTIVGENFFECSFDTAWSPPGVFLINLQNRFQNLDIRLTYELEGSDECGVFYTSRSNDKVSIANEEGSLNFIGTDGRDIYFNNDDREWHYTEDDSICDDYVSVNPYTN